MALAPWYSKDESADIYQQSVYVVKWIPKDQDVIVDHSTRYHNPSQAMQFAVNVLELKPKRIWIEDSEGAIHADYDNVLRSAQQSGKGQAASTGKHGEQAVGLTDFIQEPIATETVTRPVFDDGNEAASRDRAESNTRDEQVNEADMDPKVKTVIEEIHSLFAEHCCTGSSEVFAQPQSSGGISPSGIGQKSPKSETSDPARIREIEVLLGIAA